MSWTRVRAAAALTVLALGLRAAAAEPPSMPWVRKIILNGAHQLSRSALLGRIDLKAWRPLPEEAAVKVPGQVVEAYARSGLPPPGVQVTVGVPDGKGATHVTIDLVETPLPRLDAFRSDLGGLPWATALPTRAKLLYLKLDGKLTRFNR